MIPCAKEQIDVLGICSGIDSARRKRKMKKDSMDGWTDYYYGDFISWVC